MPFGKRIDVYKRQRRKESAMEEKITDSTAVYFLKRMINRFRKRCKAGHFIHFHVIDGAHRLFFDFIFNDSQEGSLVSFALLESFFGVGKAS